MSGQVTDRLVVSQPPKWVPSEDGAGCKTTAHLINPGVIESVPGWALVGWNIGWLDAGPEGAIVHVLPGADWVDGPPALARADKKLDGLGHNGSLWWCLAIALASPPHDAWAD